MINIKLLIQTPTELIRIHSLWLQISHIVAFHKYDKIWAFTRCLQGVYLIGTGVYNLYRCLQWLAIVNTNTDLPLIFYLLHKILTSGKANATATAATITK